MLVEDRLRRIEEMLNKLYDRLERVESLILTLYPHPVMEVALELTIAYAEPAERVVRVARKVLEFEKLFSSRDPIRRAIIEVLALRGDWLSISEVTKEVRRLRGSASRRIVSERIKELANAKILRVKEAGRRKLVKLVEDGGAR